MFHKLKVIELSTVLAGPAVGQFFAELGANVIKIENHLQKGDITRSWKLNTENANTDISAYFTAVNWGKKFISINIADENGLAIFYKLIKEADILICNFKPGDAEKLKVDFETLHKLNPLLIYGHITGYGNNNQRVGFDAIIQAEAGYVYLNGEPNTDGHKMPVALMDLMAAHQLKEGLLVALINRLSINCGEYVEVSLIQSGVASLANQASNYLVANQIPRAMGSAHPNIAPYGTSYICADGVKIVIAVGSDKQFVALCECLNIVPEERFITNNSRVKNRGDLDQILSEAFAKFLSGELLNKFHHNQIPAGSINNMEEVFKMQESLPIIIKNETSKLRGVRQAVASNIPSANLLAPNSLGFDTFSVLEHYYSLDELMKFKDDNVIFQIER